MNSDEKNMLQSLVKSDFSISKNFFDELLSYMKNRLKKADIENLK